MEINGPGGTVRLFLNEVPGSFIIPAAVVDNARRTEQIHNSAREHDRDERPCIVIPPRRFRRERIARSLIRLIYPLCAQGRKVVIPDFDKFFLANIIVVRCKR